MIKPKATGSLFDVVMNLFSKENLEKESFKGNFCRTCSALIPALDPPAVPAKDGRETGPRLPAAHGEEPLVLGAAWGAPGSLRGHLKAGWRSSWDSLGPSAGSRGRSSLGASLVCTLSWTDGH